MPRMEQFGPGLVPGQQLTVIGSGDLAHRILGLHDHWKLIGVVMVAQGPVTDKDGEKAGKAERVIIPDGLQVAPERLGPHIDAEDRLGLGPHHPLAVFYSSLQIGKIGPELADQLFLVAGLKRFEPHRPVV